MSITLTNVRCGGCGASIAPEVPDGANAVDWPCECGFLNHVVLGGSREPEPPLPDLLGAALTECSAAFDGISSHGRAREIVEVLRGARIALDPLTRAKLARVMGRGG